MKVGVSVTMINPGIRSDDAIYHDELSLIDLIEPLGFDSLVCVEHHFSAYAMIPNNLQLLSYVAGRTRRIQLVTAVIVLPWHDPIRVAEEVATLDVLSGGRAIFGFGRGSAPMEYEGFGVRMDESRQRFKEAAEIVIKGLPQERFSYDGQYFHIPEISIRPRANAWSKSKRSTQKWAWSTSASPSASAGCRAPKSNAACAYSPTASCPYFITIPPSRPARFSRRFYTHQAQRKSLCPNYEEIPSLCGQSSG